MVASYYSIMLKSTEHFRITQSFTAMCKTRLDGEVLDLYNHYSCNNCHLKALNIAGHIYNIKDKTLGSLGLLPSGTKDSIWSQLLPSAVVEL